MIAPALFLSRVARFGAIFVVSSVAACGSNGEPRSDANLDGATPAVVLPDTSYGAAALVARSEWCLNHGCVAEPIIPMDSGGFNHPFSLPQAEQAAVEAQTRDTLLVGAGLMLWKAGHTEGPETQASLVSFVRGIVGDCPAGVRHVESTYKAAASGVMTSQFVRCGGWAVRTGQLPNGFYVSVDRAP